MYMYIYIYICICIYIERERERERERDQLVHENTRHRFKGINIKRAITDTHREVNSTLADTQRQIERERERPSWRVATMQVVA